MPPITRNALALLLALLLALCLTVPAAARAEGEAAAPVQFRVHIEAPKDLADMLRDGLALARWEQDPQMTPELLQRLVDEARNHVRDAVATEGYFSANVSSDIDRRQTPWTVVLRVDPGPRTRVTDVDIGFSGPGAQDDQAQGLRQRVRESWGLPPGQPFRQEAWDAAKRDAVRGLSAWRYAGARVEDSRALIDPGSNSARLSVNLGSGPPFLFGPVQVTGTRRYPSAIVENLSPINPGDTYDRDKLLLYQRRLLEAGYFVSAQADVDAQTQDTQAAPVRVVVIEGSSQNVEAGVGYSTDAGPRLGLRYTDQDVRERAWRFKSDLRLDTKVQDLQLNLDAPPARGGRWNSGFARARQTDISNEQTQELSAGIAHNWFSKDSPSALLISGHVEEQRVLDSAVDHRHAVYFGYRRGFRRTDDLITPRQGYLGTLELGGAPPGLASRPFLRATGGASLFIPHGRSNDLVLRAQVGVVLADSRQGIPSSFLFRTGGDQTVRGYAFESLGVQQGSAIVGGRYLAVGSVEYTHWFSAVWGLAAFIDAGNAWDTGNTLSNAFKPAWGYGMGARFRTPVGPIRADLAYGERTGKLRVHFSVGYTF